MKCVWERGWLLVGVCALALGLVSSQITFSRDWTGGGKRVLNHQLIDCNQFNKICRHFIHELKQAIKCEVNPKKPHKLDRKSGKRSDYDELSYDYDEEH